MSSSRGIFKNIVVALALLSYIVISVFLVNDNRKALRCQSVSVQVLDSLSANFVTPRGVDSIIDSAYGQLQGRLIDSIDFFAIEQLIEAEPFVKWSDVFYNLHGDVVVKLTQRCPVLRLVTEGGYDFYVDTSLYLLQPSPSYVANVPMISGDIAFSFPPTYYGKLDEKKAAKDIQYIKKLINFVQYIHSDDFLRGFVMQSFLHGGELGGVIGGGREIRGGEIGGGRLKEPECRIVPRIGDQVVVIGGMDSIEQKLMKVKAFYLQYYGSPALDSVREVDVSYLGQIITR